MNRVRLTAALIVLNEEQHLRDLLPRLDFADEVVLVDGGSTDDSAAVARAAGCRVWHHPFDDFASQRNRAIAAARGEWILSIDADERPTPGLVREIKRAVSAARHAAYRVPIRSRIFGRPFRYSGTQDDRPIRLFQREAAAWQGDVHEVLQVRGAIGRLHGWLEHHTLPDLPAFMNKMQRYTTLEAQRRVTAGVAPRCWEPWVCPAREVFRRLIWKAGILDGPAGWAFCLLSGFSEWVLADKHRRVWGQSHCIEACGGARQAAASPRRTVESQATNWSRNETLAASVPAAATGLRFSARPMA